MTDTEQLEEVKKAIGITGNFQDGTIMIHMLEAKEYLKGAGVSEKKLKSSKVIGLLSRGVMDLWNYGAGSKLSNYFLERAIQLSYEEDTEEETDVKVTLVTKDGKIFKTKYGKIFVPAKIQGGGK